MEQASFNQMYRFDQSPSAQAERLRKETAARRLEFGVTKARPRTPHLHFG